MKRRKRCKEGGRKEDGKGRDKKKTTEIGKNEENVRGGEEAEKETKQEREK